MGGCYLCRHDDVVPVPAKVLDGAAHNALGFTAGVGFGGVEEVDASIEGGLETGERVLVANMTSVLCLISIAIRRS